MVDGLDLDRLPQRLQHNSEFVYLIGRTREAFKRLDLKDVTPRADADLQACLDEKWEFLRKELQAAGHSIDRFRHKVMEAFQKIEVGIQQRELNVEEFENNPNNNDPNEIELFKDVKNEIEEELLEARNEYDALLNKYFMDTSLFGPNGAGGGGADDDEDDDGDDDGDDDDEEEEEEEEDGAVDVPVGPKAVAAFQRGMASVRLRAPPAGSVHSSPDHQDGGGWGNGRGDDDEDPDNRGWGTGSALLRAGAAADAGGDGGGGGGALLSDAAIARLRTDAYGHKISTVDGEDYIDLVSDDEDEVIRAPRPPRARRESRPQKAAAADDEVRVKIEKDAPPLSPPPSSRPSASLLRPNDGGVSVKDLVKSILANASGGPLARFAYESSSSSHHMAGASGKRQRELEAAAAEEDELVKRTGTGGPGRRLLPYAPQLPSASSASLGGASKRKSDQKRSVEEEDAQRRKRLKELKKSLVASAEDVRKMEEDRKASARAEEEEERLRLEAAAADDDDDDDDAEKEEEQEEEEEASSEKEEEEADLNVDPLQWIEKLVPVMSQRRKVLNYLEMNNREWEQRRATLKRAVTQLDAAWLVQQRRRIEMLKFKEFKRAAIEAHPDYFPLMQKDKTQLDRRARWRNLQKAVRRALNDSEAKPNAVEVNKHVRAWTKFHADTIKARQRQIEGLQQRVERELYRLLLGSEGKQRVTEIDGKKRNTQTCIEAMADVLARAGRYHIPIQIGKEADDKIEKSTLLGKNRDESSVANTDLLSNLVRQNQHKKKKADKATQAKTASIMFKLGKKIAKRRDAKPEINYENDSTDYDDDALTEPPEGKSFEDLTVRQQSFIEYARIRKSEHEAVEQANKIRCQLRDAIAKQKKPKAFTARPPEKIGATGSLVWDPVLRTVRLYLWSRNEVYGWLSEAERENGKKEKTSLYDARSANVNDEGYCTKLFELLGKWRNKLDVQHAKEPTDPMGLYYDSTIFMLDLDRTDADNNVRGGLRLTIKHKIDEERWTKLHFVFMPQTAFIFPFRIDEMWIAWLTRRNRAWRYSENLLKRPNTYLGRLLHRERSRTLWAIKHLKEQAGMLTRAELRQFLIDAMLMPSYEGAAIRLNGLTDVRSKERYALPHTGARASSHHAHHKSHHKKSHHNNHKGH